MKSVSVRVVLLGSVLLAAILLAALIGPGSHAVVEDKATAAPAAVADQPAVTAGQVAAAPAVVNDKIAAAPTVRVPAVAAEPVAAAPTVKAPAVRAPTAVPTAASPITISDSYYYRYQGSKDSGACATANCGPAVFAAAIGYAKGDWLAIKDVRTYLSGKSCRGTDYNDAYKSLDHWGVDYKTTSTMKELKAAVTTRSHPVLAILYMDSINAGADYLKKNTDPAQHFGRFHDYTYGHFVVVKGFSKDGQWVIIDDPYVFDGSAWGFYKGGEAKGHNRYIKLAEFDNAFRYFGYQGIEIIPDQTSE
jgi:hypothetical protein